MNAHFTHFTLLSIEQNFSTKLGYLFSGHPSQTIHAHFTHFTLLSIEQNLFTKLGSLFSGHPSQTILVIFSGPENIIFCIFST